MRLNDYINETFFEGIENPQEVIDFLNKNCKPFISELKAGKRLFLRSRSVYASYVNDLITIKSLHSNRLPIDTPKIVSAKVDDLLRSKFGWKPRSEGYFVWIEPVNSPRIREKKHTTRIIFPIGSYKYVYNPNITDLYVEYTRIYSNNFPDKEYSEFVTFFKSSMLPNYTDKNVLKLNNKRNIECMIKANKVATLSLDMLPYIMDEYKL